MTLPVTEPGAPPGAAPASRRRGPRVLLVAPQPFFEVRGTPLNVREMARTLGEAGFEVHLATYHLGAPSSLPGLIHHRAMRVPGVDAVPIGFSKRKLVLDAALALLVWRLLLTRRFEVVHAVEESVFFTLPAAWLRRLPVIYDLDSLISDQLAYSGAVRHPGVLRAVQALERATLRRASLALTVCRSLTDAVRAAAPAVPVAQVEDCPIEGSLRPPDPALTAELRRRFVPDGARAVVYTGNLEAYQGVDLLLDALPAALERAPDAHLVIVGGLEAHVEAGRARAAAAGVAERVTFVGAQPAERMPEFMALGDALVSPRRAGGNTPLKIYSYMASGRPIVATDLATHRQVLDDETAVLAPAEPRAFGAALGDVLARPDAWRGVAERARERVLRDYSREAFERRLLDAYGRVLGRTFSAVASSM
jgi:glycosyltransferase involved in cell wall biosynthesis